MLKLIDEESNEPKNENSELDGSVDSTSYIVKNMNVGEDGIQIATEIKHFSHEHDLKLIDEVENNKKCDGCLRTILPPCYNCVECNFFLHKSCTKLPRKKQHPIHCHPLTLLPKSPYRAKWFFCNACDQPCNGFTYNCKKCTFDLDVQCSLILDIHTIKGHEHCLCLSSTNYSHSCSSCGVESSQVFHCVTCEFALDFKCATLPMTTRYRQHEHPFTLSYVVEDDSGEYYCDIYEEERDPNHWFYYCANCSYPAHPKCILEKYPNIKFGGAYTFDCHLHPLTIIEETKDHLACHKCGHPCEVFIYQCAPCNINICKFCI